MANDAIRAEIEARLASTFDRYAVTSDRIIRELAKIAFGNIGDFVMVQDDGSLVVDFGTATREQMASLKSVEVDERTIDGTAAGVRKVKISMSDKRQALMDLAKSRACCRPIASSTQARSSSRARGAQDRHRIDGPEEREQLRELLLTAPAAKAD